MTISALSAYERELIRRSLMATFTFLDEDLYSRLGITAATMHDLLSAWPHVDDIADDSDACLAINNALNDLLYGIGISDQQAQALIGADRAEMLGVYRKWAKQRGWSSTGVR